MSPKSARKPGPVGLEVVALIRERMGRQRLKQADLVRMTGIEQSTLSRIFADGREIGVDEVQAIAGVLGTTAAALITEAAENVRTQAE